ncbi:unnamed protein product [Rangifer tarandus platyrhynchus]|uniref:Uncharacterized protein n=2 Tax=Rangifer tarandus platyrhynchus TaxID=3082113 RepID=A0AC59Y341_RANTA|nr:unnamed protein product [Rangifer tarandus platyrhynchus]
MRSQVVSPSSPYLPRPLPHLFLSFLSWLVPFMTTDSEPESRFCSNDIFPISSASNGAQKFQKGFPNGPPHLGGQRLILWDTIHSLAHSWDPLIGCGGGSPAGH